MLGILVVALAVLLLLDNAGLFDFGVVARWWPVLLIVPGLLQFVWSRGAASRLVGAALAAVGGLLLYASVQPEAMSMREVWGYVWPSLLLVVGVALLVHGRRAGADEDEDRVTGFVMMSGQKVHATSAAFRGGELSAIMGGFELDLRDARMDGPEAVLELFAVMGGLELRIPPDWALESRVVCLMGGIQDETRAGPDARHVLRLDGFVMMGGIEITN